MSYTFVFSNRSLFRYTHENVLKINYLKECHFSLQLPLEGKCNNN